MSETAKLHAADGHALEAYVAAPEGTPKAALVVIQEIFGVNRHMRSVADRFAEAGYLAVVPALFDRYERGFDVGYDEAGVQRAMSIMPKMNMEWAAADTLAAIAYARDEYKTRVELVGISLIQNMAWMAAAQMPVSVAVGYYGGHIIRLKDEQLKAPTMLHFGRRSRRRIRRCRCTSTTQGTALIARSGGATTPPRQAKRGRARWPFWRRH